MGNKIEHIGYLVKSIEKTIASFQHIGYTAGDVFYDDIQQTKICFLTKTDDVKIELVEPYTGNETMTRMLKKVGVSPYHICFATNDLDKQYQELIDKGFVALFQPAPAIAFGNRRICYFWSKNIGYIEFVEL